MITSELVAQVKKEIEKGAPRSEVEAALRIVGLGQNEIKDILALASSPGEKPRSAPAVSASADLSPSVKLFTPAPEQTPPPQPVLPPPPPARITKMPTVPENAMQTPPSATEVELHAPSITSSPVRVIPTLHAIPAVPPPAPVKIPAVMKMPTAPPPAAVIPTPAQPPISAPTPFARPRSMPPLHSEVFGSLQTIEPKVEPTELRHSRFGRVVGIFALVLTFIGIGGGGAYLYMYMQKVGSSSELPYSMPVPITNLPGTNSKVPAAATNGASINATSSNSALTSSSSTTHITLAGSKILECDGMQIPLPQKWSTLAIPSSQGQTHTLDANGCYKDTVGCLCARKDPALTNGSLTFAVLVSSYPAGSRLTDLMQLMSNGRPENVKNTTFSGIPAMQFTETQNNSTLGTLIFFKNQKLYSFTFSAGGSTFKSLWPDMLVALQGTQFK